MSASGPTTEKPAQQAGGSAEATLTTVPRQARQGRLGRPVSAVDRWLESWPGQLTTTDLACFRIAYATFVLVFALPRWSWTAELPAAWFAPPPGPVALLSAPPPAWLLNAGTLVLGVFLGALLVGYRTRLVSWAIGVVWLVGNGIAFSWGKIDHVQLVAMAPLFLGAAGWGDALSIDARAGRVGPPRRWPITLFAVTIAFAMWTAGVPKVVGGWLSPATHAVHGFLSHYRFILERDEFLADWVVSLDLGHLWLVPDIATVLLEIGLVFLLIRRSLFLLGLLALVGFHLGILLTMNIDFMENVIVYGAFFAWLRPLRRALDWRALPSTAVMATGLLLGGLAAATVVVTVQRPGALVLGTLGFGPLAPSLFVIAALGSLWLTLDLRERCTKVRR